MVVIYTDGDTGKYGFFKLGTPKIQEEGTLNELEAKYKAILHAVDSCRPGEEVYILSDSILAINQIKGEWRTKDQRLRDLRELIRLLISMKGLKAHFSCVSEKDNIMAKYLRGNNGSSKS